MLLFGLNMAVTRMSQNRWYQILKTVNLRHMPLMDILVMPSWKCFVVMVLLKTYL